MVAGVLSGGGGGIMALVTTLLGFTGVVGQRRDFTFKSPESLRPRTFLLDLNGKSHNQDLDSWMNTTMNKLTKKLYKY